MKMKIMNTEVDLLSDRLQERNLPNGAISWQIRACTN
jgi:hypothetical protein